MVEEDALLPDPPVKYILISASSALLSQRCYRSIIAASKRITLSLGIFRVTSPEVVVRWWLQWPLGVTVRPRWFFCHGLQQLVEGGRLLRTSYLSGPLIPSSFSCTICLDMVYVLLSSVCASILFYQRPAKNVFFYPLFSFKNLFTSYCQTATLILQQSSICHFVGDFVDRYEFLVCGSLRTMVDILQRSLRLLQIGFVDINLESIIVTITVEGMWSCEQNKRFEKTTVTRSLDQRGVLGPHSSLKTIQVLSAGGVWFCSGE